MCEICTRDDIRYEPIALESCLPLVQGFIRQQHRWHSHVLSPRCAFNPYPELYAIVVEDDTAGKAYIAPSDGFPEVDKQFVRMLHGDDILDAGHPASEAAVLGETSPFLARLVDLDDRGVAWHHHMNFPSCVLNPHPGDWAITLESAEGTFSSRFDNEPVDVLRAIEVRYFRNLENLPPSPDEGRP